MRNLAVVTELRNRVALANGEKLVAAAYDSHHGRFFFASDTCTLYSLPASGSEDEWRLSLVEPAESKDVLDLQLGDRVIALEYVMEEDALLVAIEAGDLLLLRPPAHDVEVVGRVEGGIVSMAASPDGELMALATGFGQILLMTQDWDVLHEVSIAQAADASEKASHAEMVPAGRIHISWRGDGKYFTTLEMGGTGDVKIWERDTGTLYASAENVGLPKTAITWSPSGARICTSCNASSSSRPPAVVFFEKNGLKKENFDIIGPPHASVDVLKWNCDSSLLLAVLRCGDWDGVQVWNCRNYHWYLKQEWRFPGTDNVDILWDPEKPLRLTCWTHGGWLQTLDMCWSSAVVHNGLALVIDGKDLLVTPLALALIPPPMSLFKMSFQSPVQAISFHVASSSRTVLAAYLSDGYLGVITCPGIAQWIDFEDQVVTVQTVEQPPSFYLLNPLRHLTWLNEGILLGVESCSPGRITANRDTADGHTGHRGADVLVEVGLSSTTKTCSSSIDTESWTLNSLRRVEANQAVTAVAVSEDKFLSGASALIQFRDGTLHTYVRHGNQPQREATLRSAGRRFGSASPWMKVLPALSKADVLVGLDVEGHLQVDDRIVDRECTSFTLHSGTLGSGRQDVVHLVYTTRSNLLHVACMQDVLGAVDHGDEVLGLAQQLDTCKITPTQSSSVKLKHRSSTDVQGTSVKPTNMWERGARLVGTLDGAEVGVVLQTVRGNLETLYPRRLVLGAIAAALVHGNFGDAMTLVRRHHINPNVIVDYQGWESFVPVAGIFVQQVRNLSHITDFICALKKDNLMLSLYRDLVPPFDPSSSSAAAVIKGVVDAGEQAASNKVQGVVTAVRTALEKEISPSPARELCILTTLACNEPPQLEEALSRVKKIREVEMSGESTLDTENAKETNVTQSSHTLTAARAVKHLIWLTDADKVYNAALGLYDLFLAAMVASEAQRDPKEFLPLLEELEGMRAPLMCYTIDFRLGRYESALKHLIAAGDDHFQDCVKLVLNNPSLFPLALEIVVQSDKRKEIMSAWGDHLLAEENFVDAAAAFSAAGQLDRVLAAYRAGGLWEGVLSVAGQLKMTKDARQKLAHEVCEELQAMGRPGEAAIVAREYLQDVDLSVMLLVDARDWKHAIRLSTLHDRADLLTKVEMGALESANGHVTDFEEGLEKIGKYYTRYLAVRQRRLVLQARLKEEQTEEDDMNDAASDTSSSISGISGMSIYTRGTRATPTGTSVNVSTKGASRKQQKQTKKLRGGGLRAGSPGEELALLEHLKELAMSTQLKEELGPLLQVLVFCAHDEAAKRLQDVASRYECTQQAAVRLADKKRAEETTAEGMVHEKNLHQVEEVRWKLEVLRPPQGVQPASFLSTQ